MYSAFRNLCMVTRFHNVSALNIEFEMSHINTWMIKSNIVFSLRLKGVNFLLNTSPIIIIEMSQS